MPQPDDKPLRDVYRGVMRLISTLSTRLRSIPPLLVDTGAALAVTGITLKVTAGSYPATGPRRFDMLAFFLTLASNAPTAFRRRAPRTVLIVCTTALAVYEACGYWLGPNELGPQFAYFTVATKCGRGWTAAGALFVFPVIMYTNVHTFTGSAFDTLALTVAWLVVLGIFGDGGRRLAEHNALVREHAAQIQREVREREQRAVLHERIRIARELHDVVAHHMSVIAVQAGLARYVFSSDPETAEKALVAVSEMSSEGLQEVRRLVTVLRPEADERADADPGEQQTRGIEQLPSMIERIGLTGIPVTLTVTGTRQPLPAGVGLCVYRVVQEALTNVIKHAAAATAEVHLSYTPREVSVRITDDGRSGGPRPHAPDLGGSGKGLVGMRERASLYGGTLRAGKLPEGGFEVCLAVPIRGGSGVRV